MKKFKAEIFLFFITLFIIAFAFYKVLDFGEEVKPIVDTIAQPVAEMRWGLPLDSIQYEMYTVKATQNLGDILSKKGISAQNIDQISRSNQAVFDVRRMRTGNRYSFVYKKGVPTMPIYFIYEENAIDYVVFQLTGELKASRGKKEVETQIRTVSGVIRSSLWNSMVENRTSPELAMKLSDLFAWTIDFFGIKSGDNYKIIYEENFVDGRSIGIGQIQAAYMEQNGEKFYAFKSPKSTDEFYDFNGGSLKKAFLKAPLSYSRISSGFSERRFHPVLKIVRPHHGVDYAAPTGTPVFSIGDGMIVQKAFELRGGGNYLTIKHNSVYSSQYMHLSKFAPGIASGIHVKQGQVIGYVGQTGLASGPHLDFRIYMNGTAVNPLTIKAPPVEPVSKEDMPAFITLRDSLSKELEAIPLAKH